MDLIDRNAVLNRYQEICNGIACMDCPFNKDGCAFEKLILDSAVVDAELVRHGHWIFTSKPIAYWGTTIKCSVCGYEGVVGNIEEYHYCWHCGAKMDEVEE